jgi:hypothetical protein
MPRGQLLDDCILKHATVTHIIHHWLTALVTNLVHKRSLFSSVMRPWYLQVHIFFLSSRAKPSQNCPVRGRDVPTPSGWAKLVCYIISLELSCQYTCISALNLYNFAFCFKSSVFWDTTLCSPLEVNRRFGGTCRPHLQGRRIRKARNQHEAVRKVSVIYYYYYCYYYHYYI